MPFKCTCRMLLAAVAVLALTTVSHAASIPIFNTGVNGSGNVLGNGAAEQHYTLVSEPSGATNLVVRTSAGGFPIPPYIGDDALSAWILPNNGNAGDGWTSPVGTYDYQTSFSLAGLNPSTASLTIRWSTDDGGLDVLLNGASLGHPSSGHFALGFAAFAVNSGFVAGTNTLDFLVHNDDCGGLCANPTALRVEASGTASPVPEPGSLALVGTGVLGLAAIIRRKLML